MSTQKRPRHRPSPTAAAQNVVTFIALSYLGIFLIKLLTKPPEVGKAMANLREIMFAFDAPPSYSTLHRLLHSRAVWLCPCVRQIAGLQTRSVFGVWTTDRPLLAAGEEVPAAGSELQWGFSANLRPAGRDGTFWSEWWWWLCGRRPSPGSSK